MGSIMNGVLTSINGVWCVKWSDLHSFAHGTHWMFTKLSPDSKSIFIVKDNKVEEIPFSEGLRVNFKNIVNYYDDLSYEPITTAKLIFPDVELFEKESLIREYVSNNDLFIITDVDIIRDGGTIVLRSNKKQYYIHKDDWTIHDNYPTTNDNLVIDKPTQVYLLDKLHKYKEDIQFKLTKIENIIERVRL
jgi:hypothetical protein